MTLVGAIGFEPTTPCAQGRCATRLRYAPTSNYCGGSIEIIEATKPFEQGAALSS
jgi:hypothetical protein